MGGTSHKANVERLDAELKQLYKDNRVDSRLQGDLTVERLRASAKNKSGYPKLRGKAAATRHMAPFVLMLARRWDSGTPHDRLRTAVNELIVRVYEIYEASKQYLSENRT